MDIYTVDNLTVVNLG